MVRTRFAPSPTGYLHIGGVRTALFNWLFARQHGGQFLLRIDDTDAERNVAEALQPILDGFRWLGIDWDEGADIGGPNGPYYQSQKTARYQHAVQELIDREQAYWDYATPDEMQAERKAAEAKKEPFLYSRNWMAQTPAERARFEAQGRTGVVRLKMPRQGACTYHDDIRGDMEVAWITEADHVIQRADGSCLYNLANVIDDHDMKITHVIRAAEHLSNTPRQIFILRGLGYAQPEYAHLPLVAAPGGKDKLSKRKLPEYLKNADFKNVFDRAVVLAQAIGLDPCGDTFNPVIVDFYQQLGYLPDAILNYIVRLGWSKDDRTEYFTRDEMIRDFKLEQVGKGPAAFDVKKLNATQEYWMQQVPLDRKVDLCLPFLVRAKLVAEPVSDAVREQVRQIVQAAAHRIVIAGDVLDYNYFFVTDDRLEYDEKAFDKHLRKPAGAKDQLRDLGQRLAGLEPFDSATLEAAVKALVETWGVKLGQANQTLRVAVTGKDAGFGTYETLALLGKPRCLARIQRALAMLAPTT
jgi:glutamyl-tRNA synthetase